MSISNETKKPFPFSQVCKMWNRLYSFRNLGAPMEPETSSSPKNCPEVESSPIYNFLALDE